jgi:hypothetical protein
MDLMSSGPFFQDFEIRYNQSTGTFSPGTCDQGPADPKVVFQELLQL